MIIHLLKFKVLPKDHSNAVRTIQAVMGPTIATQECQTCALYSSVDNDDELLLLQKWVSQKAMDNYVSSPKYKLLLEGIELALEQPTIEFHKVTDSNGLEYVEKTRKSLVRSTSIREETDTK